MSIMVVGKFQFDIDFSQLDSDFTMPFLQLTPLKNLCDGLPLAIE